MFLCGGYNTFIMVDATSDRSTIYFIRHGAIDNPTGEYYGRAVDVPLSWEGKKQAEIIGTIISRGGTVDRIYTSPLSRAAETAEIIGGLVGSPRIIKEDGLIDVDIPALLGRQLGDRSEIHGGGGDEYSGEWVKLGNEPREQITARMLGAFEKICEENEGKAVVVSHGDPLRILKFCLENPGKQVPPMSELLKSYYPEKGEGWKIVVDGQGNILETELVRRLGSVRAEKEI